jgi:hypothetical protein
MNWQEASRQLRELSAYTHSVRGRERTRIARGTTSRAASVGGLKMDAVGWLTSAWAEQKRGAEPASCVTPCAANVKKTWLARLTAVDNGRIITDCGPASTLITSLWAALDWQAHEFVHQLNCN